MWLIQCRLCSFIILGGQVTGQTETINWTDLVEILMLSTCLFNLIWCSMTLARLLKVLETHTINECLLPPYITWTGYDQSKKMPPTVHLQYSEQFQFDLTKLVSAFRFSEGKTLTHLNPQKDQCPKIQNFKLSSDLFCGKTSPLASKKDTVECWLAQRYRPMGRTFMQVKLSGYLDNITGLPSIRTSLRLGLR